MGLGTRGYEEEEVGGRVPSGITSERDATKDSPLRRIRRTDPWNKGQHGSSNGRTRDQQLIPATYLESTAAALH
ncbi:hypothetical protein Y1Q_0015199 [Alligator mississippiensis]|uniref:Uncharacterized protein n=1 Tax=Alligator mississippiensis TaxID=8496 RepID=A0A151P9B1_ALLMI|nr:hypothetical protein Y1Q_0015199 [Alligator mississippiensis]